MTFPISAAMHRLDLWLCMRKDGQSAVTIVSSGLKSVQGPDDYASMEEVLTRRFEHGIREREEGSMENSFTAFPDLILMDGGRGQVNIALEVLDKLRIHIPVCGMVKDDNHRTRGLYYNNVEIPIDRNSEGFS